MTAARVPVLVLSAPQGWCAYVRYDGDDQYILHCQRGRRSAALRLLSRGAAAEYLSMIMSTRELEMALLEVSSEELERETFGAYARAEDAPDTAELFGSDRARCGYEEAMNYLLLLRDVRSLAA